MHTYVHTYIITYIHNSHTCYAHTRIHSYISTHVQILKHKCVTHTYGNILMSVEIMHLQATRNTGKNIAGKNIVNPASLIFASADLLEHLGYQFVISNVGIRLAIKHLLN